MIARKKLKNSFRRLKKPRWAQMSGSMKTRRTILAMYFEIAKNSWRIILKSKIQNVRKMRQNNKNSACLHRKIPSLSHLIRYICKSLMTTIPSHIRTSIIGKSPTSAALHHHHHWDCAPNVKEKMSAIRIHLSSHHNLNRIQTIGSET